MSYTYKYPRPAVTTDCLIIHAQKNNLEILLIQRKNDPYQHMWALPGGFVEIDESLDVAAKRELMEETGLDHTDLKQFRAYGDPDRDPRGRTISVVFYGLVSEKSPQIKAGDDAGDARWFPVDHLPTLAFDHAKVISDAKDTIFNTIG